MSERYTVRKHTADVRKEKGVCNKSFSDWISKCEDSRKFYLCIERYKTLEWITLRLCQITKPVLFLVMHLICYILNKKVFCYI